MEVTVWISKIKHRRYCIYFLISWEFPTHATRRTHAREPLVLEGQETHGQWPKSRPIELSRLAKYSQSKVDEWEMNFSLWMEVMVFVTQQEMTETCCISQILMVESFCPRGTFSQDWGLSIWKNDVLLIFQTILHKYYFTPQSVLWELDGKKSPT